MIAAILPLGVASVAVATIVSGYILKYSDQEIVSKKAVGLVENARLLKRLSDFDSSQNRSYLSDSYKMPFSSLIVRDSNTTSEEVNALSKQYEAIGVLLENDPNFSDVDNCVLMASTKKISEDECELVKDKQFKVYALENGSVSFDVENNTSVMSHIKSLESAYANINADEINVVEGESESVLTLGTGGGGSLRSLRREFAKEDKAIGEINAYLGSGDLAAAGAAVNKLALNSKNYTLVKNQLDRVSKEILVADVSSAEALARVDTTKAFIASAAVKVIEKAGVDSTVSANFIADQSSLSEVMASSSVTSEANSYIGAELESKVLSYFGSLQ